LTPDGQRQISAAVAANLGLLLNEFSKKGQRSAFIGTSTWAARISYATRRKPWSTPSRTIDEASPPRLVDDVHDQRMVGPCSDEIAGDSWVLAG
jgi:hypothetical protein